MPDNPVSPTDAVTSPRTSYKLSKRTLEQLKIFESHVADAEERQQLANLLLSISPFAFLFDKPDPTSAYQIGATDWELLGRASQGFRSALRDQLWQFCRLEAAAQASSGDDLKFWLRMAEQFSRSRSPSSEDVPPTPPSPPKNLRVG